MAEELADISESGFDLSVEVRRFAADLPYLLDPFQAEAMEAILAGRSALVVAPTGTGKALAATTPVLTPTGWVVISDLRPGDSVIGARGQPITVIGVYPQGKRPAYRVTFTDGVSVVCDEEHLWAVNTRSRRHEGLSWRILTLRQILSEGLADGIGHRHFVPLIEPVEFRRPDIPTEELSLAAARSRSALTQRALAARMGVSQGAIAAWETGRHPVPPHQWPILADAFAEAGPRPRLHPYLLGLLLGDGGLSTGRMRFTSADDHLISTARRLLPPGAALVRAVGSAYDWHIVSSPRRTRNPVVIALRELGLLGHRAGDKFVPHSYKFAPVPDRVALLQGLLDTDGSIDRHGCIEYTTVSPALAEDVAFLVRSLGGRASLRRKSTGFQTAYRMHVILPDGIAPFSLRRKAERWQARLRRQPSRAIKAVEPVGAVEMTCIAVDASDGLYVVDGFVVTHNTVIAEFAVDWAIRTGMRAVYTAPIKALSNQTFRIFRLRHGDRVGLMTGDVVENPNAPVLVMTTEVLRNLLLEGTTPTNIGCVIFDEIHYLADPERGTAWEETIILAPQGVPLLCLSATVANAEELAGWLRQLRGPIDLIRHEQRAVPLEHHYYLGGKLLPFVGAEGRRAGRIPNAGGEALQPGRRARPEVRPWEVVRKLADDDLLPAIYFLFSRRAVEASARYCATVLGGRLGGNAGDAALEALDRHLAGLGEANRSLSQIELLRYTLPRGVGVHHAGLLPALKVAVEELLATGVLKAVFATETLALGINAPARSVVIGELTKYDGQSRRLLTPNEYHQLTGRAGRRGLDRRGFAVNPYSSWVTAHQTYSLLVAPLLPLESAFRLGYNAVVNLWRGPESEAVVEAVVTSSLRWFQNAGERANRNERRELQRLRGSVPAIRRILERYGYLERGHLTRKGEFLRHIFDPSGLVIAELVFRRGLADLSPAELAELCAWFVTDREFGRYVALTPRLRSLNRRTVELATEILATERRWDVEVTPLLPLQLTGVVYSWGRGAVLAALSEATGTAEGEILQLILRVLDLLEQLRSAIAAQPQPGILAQRIVEAEALLRRDVVDHYYRSLLEPPPRT